MPTEVVPNTIPAAYGQFGGTRGFTPKPFHRLRWLIKSKMGLGKSTFLSSIPNSLHLDIEGGAHSVVNDEAVRIPVNRNPEVLMGVIAQLVKDGEAAKGNPDKLPFQVVSIDPIDALADVMADIICKEKSNANRTIEYIGEFGEKGAGYQLLYVRIQKLLHLLESLGYTWALTCHLREKDITTKEGGMDVTRTVVRPSVGDSLARSLENAADISAVIRNQIMTDEVPTVIELAGGRKVNRMDKVTRNVYTMQVECDPQNDAKRRVFTFKGDIPMSLRGGWKNVGDFYAEKVAEMKQLLESGGPIPTK
jgi:hypothetical protein